MQQGTYHMGQYGEVLVQLGRKEQATVQLGRRNDKTGDKKKGGAHQQPRTTSGGCPRRPRRLVRCGYLSKSKEVESLIRTFPQASLPLPSEIFTIVAEFLAGANQFGTLANLNVTNHLVREATNIALWTTIVLDSKLPRWNIVGIPGVVLPFRDMVYISASWQKRGRKVYEVPGLPTNLKYVR
jgi:hypothetical protein